MSPDNLTFPVRRDADPPFPGGFLLMGAGLRASRKSGLYAPDCVHTASLPDNRQPINHASFTRVRRAAPGLATAPVVRCSANQNNLRTKLAEWCRSILCGCRTRGLRMWPCSNAARADT